MSEDGHINENCQVKPLLRLAAHKYTYKLKIVSSPVTLLKTPFISFQYLRCEDIAMLQSTEELKPHVFYDLEANEQAGYLMVSALSCGNVTHLVKHQESIA